MRARWLRRFPLAIASLAALLVACSTVPYTDRTRVILMSEEEELQLGAQAYDEVLKKGPISHDAAANDLVGRVGSRIAAVADCPNYQWQFTVIDSPKTVNAFCLPGGKVAVYTGILPVCGDETGLAVVMGHEIAHAIARHGAERVSQQMVLNAGAAVLAAVIAGKSHDNQETVAALLGAGFGVAFALPFSRKHESEADHIGLMIMAKAGYDPREAPRFWERMEKIGGGKQPPEFLSTHPSHERRKEDLEDLVPDAMVFYQQAIGHDVGYTKKVLQAR